MIVDVLVSHSPYSGNAHYYVINDEPVKYVYTRDTLSPGDGFWSRGTDSSMFIGRCGDFFDFLSGTSRKGDAFGGSEFAIDLDDGSKFRCNGDVWSCGPPKGFEPIVGVGVATLAELNDCYCFRGGNIRKATLEQWLSEHEPSTDYYKYDEKHRWWRDVLPTLRIVRSSKRARHLRKRGGTDIHWEPRVNAWVWQPNQKGGEQS